jgi:hypothetical protein
MTAKTARIGCDLTSHFCQATGFLGILRLSTLPDPATVLPPSHPGPDAKKPFRFAS